MTIYRILLLAAAITTYMPASNTGALDYVIQEHYSEIQKIELEVPNSRNPSEDIIYKPIIDTPLEPLEYSPIEVPIQPMNYFENYKLILRQDIISEDVLMLKKFLFQKGYLDRAEGYYYDNILKEAVINYQRDNGLIADGIVGVNTLNKINEDIGLKKIYIPERTPQFTKDVPKGNWIFINKSSNTLYFLNDDKVIERYNVATGKTEVDTPEGKCKIVVKQVNPYWCGAGKYDPIKGGDPTNPLGKRWMGLSIGGGGEYGIHGNAAFNSIGKYVSLGCIRMYNEDVEYLFDMIQKGTPVWIGNEYKLQDFGITFQ